MGVRFRSWWQKARISLEVFGVIIGCMLIIALLVVIVLAYLFNVNVPGLRGKTLWDWMQLLFIPVVLAIAGFWFNHRERKAAELRAENEWKAAEDNQREEALQAYLRTMSELIFERHLQHKEPMAIGWPVTRAHTLTVLSRLDANRKRSVLQFLRETELIINEDDDKRIDHIRGKLKLHGADLSGANLRNLKLDKANLSETNLSGANLSEAILTGADLSGANLSEATGITIEELEKQAKSLQGATMPDGSMHP